MSSELSPAYRRDIDGLRAVAVLSVLTFHAFPSLLPGGFIGVDIFFVISGFLITTIILGGLKSSTFSYTEFYSRRARRIFPALALVLSVSFVIGWQVLLPTELALLGKHIAAGTAFLSNFTFWNEAGYFDSDLKPLLHLWSLGIEEQFYLLWPLLLGLAWKRKTRVVALIVGVAVLSFAVNIATISSHPSAAFYSPLSRFWELMIGGALAYIRLQRPSPALGWLAHIQSGAGLLLIALGLYFIRPDGFPGWWALMPTTGAVLCIAAGPSGFLNRYLLASRPMVWIGLISYPLYLWHWPLLAFARVVAAGLPAPSVRVAMLGLAVVLAVATYFLLERPIRFGGSSKRAKVWALTSVLAAVGFAGLVTFVQNGFGSRLVGTEMAFASHEFDFRTGTRAGVCWVSAAAAPNAFPSECVDPPEQGKPLVAIWGDSHAAHLYAGLRAANEGRFRLAQFTRDACVPILGFGDADCIAANAWMVEKFRELRPQTVIIFASWTFYMTPNGAIQEAEVKNTIAKLREAGVEHVVVAGPAPRWEMALPNFLVEQRRVLTSLPIPMRSKVGIRKVTDWAEGALEGMVRGAPGADYFSTYNALCNEDGCLTLLENSPEGLTTYDYGHLTTSAATIVGRELFGTLSGRGRSPSGQ